VDRKLCGRCRDTVRRLGTIPKSHGNCHSKESVSGPGRATPPPLHRHHLSSASGTNLPGCGEQAGLHTVHREIHERNNGSVGELGTNWQICSFELRLP
jgi:hypothetical protein